MNNLDAALKRYYRSVSGELPCTGRMKKQIMLQLQESVGAYLEQNPGADFEEIQAHFGTPRDIASGYIDDQDAPALLRKLHIKKRILMIVAGVLAAMLLVWLSVMAWAVAKEMNSANGTISEGGITIVE